MGEQRVSYDLTIVLARMVNRAFKQLRKDSFTRISDFCPYDILKEDAENDEARGN